MENLNIERRSVIRCEVCGDFHDEDDCELITIQIIKGKGCKLIKDNLFIKTPSVPPILHVNDDNHSKTREIKEENINDNSELREKLKDPNTVKILTPTEKTELLKKRNSGIPPAFLRRLPHAEGNVFVPPDDSRADAQGAKYRAL